MKQTLKSLKFHSWHRGTRENDILLGEFADTCLDSLSDNDIKIYASLLNESDPDLFHWIVVGDKAPSHYQPLLQQIKACHQKKHQRNNG